MYVETDFLFALAKSDDWLQPEAEAALECEDVHTSLLAYAEFLVRAYEPGEGFRFDVSGTVANLLELVPVRPEADEAALLAATVYLDEHDVTPFERCTPASRRRVADGSSRRTSCSTSWTSSDTRWNRTPSGRAARLRTGR